MRIPVAIASIVLISAAVASAADASARGTLNKRLNSVRFDQIALVDVVDYFRDTTGANVVVEWKELELVGIGKDSTVSLKLRNVPTRKALQAALEAAAPGLLTFYISENVITITTQAKADSVMITRSYPVQDLIVDIPDFTGPSLALTDNIGGKKGRDSTSRSGGGSSSGGSSLFGGGDNNSNKDEEKSKTKTERAQSLIDLITSTIRPEIWDVNGGKATIKFFNGHLIITAPRSVQEAIGGPID
jgi:hypothetical protein